MEAPLVPTLLEERQALFDMLTNLRKQIMNKEDLRVQPEIWAPHPYQTEAIKFLISRGSAQLWLDP